MYKVGGLVVCLAAACTLGAQTISSVVNAASTQPRLAPGCLALITGADLASPVTVGGKPAHVFTSSPTQMAIQIPIDAAVGDVPLQIGSAVRTITLSQYAPAFFVSNGLVAGTHSDGSPISNNNAVYPGETINLFVNGLGATNPVVATGAISPAGIATVAHPVVQYASETATVVSSTLAPGQIGIYQVTIKLTDAAVTGVRNMALTIGGVQSPIVSLPVEKAWEKPAITNVISATGIPGSIQDAIQPGSWVAVYGSGFTPFSRDWTGEVVNGRLPTVLSGIRVSVGGKPAAVYFTSSGQINVLAPDVASGTVPVVVTYLGETSNSFSARVQTHAPAFFQWGSTKYAVATRFSDNGSVGGPSGGSVRPGDILILWGTGFGPTQPAVPSLEVAPSPGPAAVTPSVTVGGRDAKVYGAALTPGFAGVYQVAIEVPAGLPVGDALVRATVAGFSTPDGVYTNIGQ